jgi:NAD(P)-dependent dehydrogenase (short-subunit alcohol dehydrogenase family)
VRRAGRTYVEGMHDKLVALVTGANKGIGLQIAKDLAARGLTVLVGSRNLEEKLNNGRPSVVPLAGVRAVFETNVFGVIAVTQAMLPLLREAPAGRVVNVSSEVGSLTKQTDPTNPYRSIKNGSYSPSKTALNAITVAFANELEGTRMKVNAACPGFTATDLNNFRGTRTVQQGAREPVRLALLDANGPTGTFSNEDGALPW